MTVVNPQDEIRGLAATLDRLIDRVDRLEAAAHPDEEKTVRWCEREDCPRVHPESDHLVEAEREISDRDNESQDLRDRLSTAEKEIFHLRERINRALDRLSGFVGDAPYTLHSSPGHQMAEGVGAILQGRTFHWDRKARL